MTQPANVPSMWVDAHGGVFKIQPTAGEVAKAQKAGWTPASDADVQAALGREKAGTLPEQAKTAAEGFASGALSAGLAVPRLASAAGSKLAGGDFSTDLPTGREALSTLEGISGAGGFEGAPEAAQQAATAQRTRAAANPLTADISYGAGQLAAAAGMGATSGAQALGGATTRALGGRLAARLAGGAVAGAAEGAAYMPLQAEDQAYLENRKLTGEQVLASAGLGALMGGGLGFAAKGAEEVFGAAKTALTNRLGASPAEGEASAVRRILRTDDASINKVAGSTLGETPLPKTADYIRDGVRGADLKAVTREAHEEATATLAESVNKATKTVEDLAQKVDNKAWKLSQVEQHAETFAPDALQQTRARIGAIREDLDATLEGLGKRPPEVLKGLAERVKAAEFAADSTESAAKANIVFDQLRRDLNTTSRTFGQAFANAGNVDAKSLYEVLSNKIGAHYDDSWKFLMDKSVWGEQGAAQEAVNMARADLIKAQKYALPYVANEVSTEYQGLGRATKVMEANEGKIIGLVQKMGTTEGAFAERRLNQYINASKGFAEAMEKYGLDGGDAAAVAAVKEHAANLQGALSAATDKVGAVNQATTFLEKAHEGSGATGAGLLGHLVGGQVGAVAGAVAGAVSNPAKFMSQRMALEQMASRAEKLFGRGLDAFFEPVANGVSGAVSKARRVFSDAGIPSALTAFQGKHASPELAYRARAQQLLDAQANYGQRLRDSAYASFGDLSATEPHAVGSAVVAATTAVNYLVGKLPAGLVDTQTLSPYSSKPVPSRAEIQDFARVWQAVDKPMSVLRDLANGTITHDQVEAVRTVYPRVYAQWQDTAMSKIRELDGKGTPVPIRQRLALDTALDLNGAGERTFSPDFCAKYAPQMGDAQNQEPPRPAPRPGPTNVASRLSTGTARILGG